MCDLTGRTFALVDVLTLVLKQLSERLQPGNLWNAQVREGWQQRCFMTGKRIQIDLGVRQAEGLCLGIDEDGALLLDVEEEVERHFAGVVTLLDKEESGMLRRVQTKTAASAIRSRVLVFSDPRL